MKKIATLAVLLLGCQSGQDNLIPTGPTPSNTSNGTGGECGCPDGPTGPQGSEGKQGPQGDIGPTGPKGAKGDTGSQGPAGYNGLAGATGPTGPQGFQGSAGPGGPIGAKGDQGSPGPTGPTGADGVPRSKADIYVVADTSGQTTESVKYCNDVNDIVMSGGCWTNSLSGVSMSMPVYPADTGQVSGWMCRVPSNWSVWATAVCIDVP